MKKLLISLVVMGFVCTGAAQADSITVDNYSFELPGTVKQLNWENVPGWSSDAVAADSGVDQSALATEGTWNGFMWSADGPVWNLTGHIISAGEEFTLTIDSGSGGADRSTTMGLYYYDGTTRQSLGSATNSVPQGSMSEYVFEVSATTASVGYPIGIELVSPASYVGMDNVRLDVIPEPATMTLLGLGSLALLKRRRA